MTIDSDANMSIDSTKETLDLASKKLLDLSKKLEIIIEQIEQKEQQ